MTDTKDIWGDADRDPEADRLAEALKEEDWTLSIPKRSPVAAGSNPWADVGELGSEDRWAAFLALPDWTRELARERKDPRRAAADREFRRTIRHRVEFELALGADLSIWSPAQMQAIWERTRAEVGA